MVKPVANKFVNTNMITSDISAIRKAKVSALPSEISRCASGRFAVRPISRSLSLSITILKAFAAPAASVPPTKVASETPSGGTPPAARKRAGRVVTSKSSTTRNFIRAIYGAALFTRSPYNPANPTVALSFLSG